jgi:flagellin
MRINYNVSAGITNKHLLNIEDSLAESMEKLSSGLKINKSKDSPAGMAISNKMRVQIAGLDRASQNASDGVSAVQIADGALDEVTNILQRMRELSVQAASDATMSLEDKQAIQDEIASLKDEIDRVSTDTEYNTKKLLNGDLDRRVYVTDLNATRVEASDELLAGKYTVEITQAATQASATATNTNFNDTNKSNTVGTAGAGTISINGSSTEILETDTYEEAYEKIREAAKLGEVDATRDGTTGAITFSSTAYGEDAALSITCSNARVQSLLGTMSTTSTPATGAYAWVTDAATGTSTYKNNTTGEAVTGQDLKVDLSNSGFSDSATVKTEGNKVTISDFGGKTLTFLAKEGVTGDIEFNVTDIGQMVLHVGANMDQEMTVRIPEVSTESLYIDDLDVTTVNGGSTAITKLDDAIAKVSSVRSDLGAYENRLEYTSSSLDEFQENMTDSLSRLTDVDMAEEMTNYTQYTVLNQAAISVLTQANEIPQQILQIMQL